MTGPQKWPVRILTDRQRRRQRREEKQDSKCSEQMSLRQTHSTAPGCAPQPPGSGRREGEAQQERKRSWGSSVRLPSPAAALLPPGHGSPLTHLSGSASDDGVKSTLSGGLPREPLPFPTRQRRRRCSLLAFHLLDPPPPPVFFFGVTEQAHFQAIRDSSNESGPASRGRVTHSSLQTTRSQSSENSVSTARATRVSPRAFLSSCCV